MKKNETIQIRVTPEFKKAIEKKAKNEGMTLTDYCRYVLTYSIRYENN